ncbi:MAG: PAS domain S-box protein [Candidatus Methanoperedens sp.]|nr:PAS domain S-box protein [Candidatus Methanoperedens sp.]
MNKIPKVLVVDDNEDGRLLLTTLLTLNNYEVKEACNGIEALESLKASKPDLIISDILMPEMDGFTLIRELNKDISGGKIPVVLYSAQYINEKDKELAKKLGASRFITKPAEPKEILKEIKTVIAKFESAEQKHIISHISTDEEYLSEYAERLFRKLEDKVKELEQEITRSKRAEYSLKLSEKKYRDLFDNANDAICIVDTDLKFTDINTKTLELTGYSKEEILKMSIFDLIPREQVPRSNEEFKKLREKGHYEKFIGKLVTKSGSMIDVEVNSSAIIEDNRIIGSMDILRDITVRKLAEDALRESEGQLKRAHRAAHLGNWEWDLITNELYWAEENYIIHGIDPQKVKPSYEAFIQVVDPAEQEFVNKAVADALAGKRSFDIDYTVSRPDNGEKCVINSKADVIVDSAGKAVKMVGTVQDITERKQAEATIREREERLHQAVRVSQIGIFDHDHLTDSIYWSPEQRHIYGFGHEEPITLSAFFKHLYPEDSERIAEAVRRAHDPAGDGSFDVEHRIVDRNGSIHWVSTRSRTHFEGEGSLRRPVRTVGAVADITERKSAEEKIETSLKEKEILLREIHHRVKNNMQIISSLLGLASGSIKDKKYADMFHESQNRITSMSLIHEKLYRSRDLAKIDLKEYIRDLANAIFQSCGVKNGMIVLNINIENVHLGVDHSIPLGLIVNELITNSLKYAFPGERKAEIKVSLHLIDENTFELIISDNGVGIPYNVDFRKTESLGLRLVTLLVENQLKGKIDLDRSKGTEFNIKFQGNNNGKKSNNGC